MRYEVIRIRIQREHLAHGRHDSGERGVSRQHQLGALCLHDVWPGGKRGAWPGRCERHCRSTARRWRHRSRRFLAGAGSRANPIPAPRGAAALASGHRHGALFSRPASHYRTPRSP